MTTINEAIATAAAWDVRRREVAEAVRGALAAYDGKGVSRNFKRISAKIQEALAGKCYSAELSPVASSHWSVNVYDTPEAKRQGSCIYLVVCYGETYDAAKFADLNGSCYSAAASRGAAREAVQALPAVVDHAAELVALLKHGREEIARVQAAIKSHLDTVYEVHGFDVKEALDRAIAAALK